MNRDFGELAELLNVRGVEYLVVGGYALAAHGHPRYTGDIDFWISPTPMNVDRLLAALKEFGFGSVGLSSAGFTDDSVIQLGMAPRRIDLLTRIDGVEFDACWHRRDTMQVDGMPLNFIGLRATPALRAPPSVARPARPC